MANPRFMRAWTITISRDEHGRPVIAIDLPPAQQKRMWHDLRVVLDGLGALSNEIFDLTVQFAGSQVRLSGAVASEQTMAVIRTLLASDQHIVDIDDCTIVTAPFVSAADEDDWGVELSTGDSFEPAGGTGPFTSLAAVTRHPSIRSLNRAEPGRKLFLEIDLALEPDTATNAQPIEFNDLPADWTRLTVDVEVFSTDLRFGPSAHRGQIDVRRDAPSVPFRLEAIVSETAAQSAPLEILVVFSHAGRHAGFARRELEVSMTPARQAVGRSESQVRRTGAVSIVPGASAPPLTVKIFSQGSPGTYLWVVDAPEHRQAGGRSHHGIVDLGPSTKDYAYGLLAQCPRLAPGQHAGTMRGVGERIWQRTPSCFRTLYVDLRKALGPGFPIQIVTQELDVPWELMHPDADAKLDDADHLFMSHPITRWFADYEGLMPASFKDGAIASFVPNYASGGTLPEAIDEGKWLVSSLGASAQTPTYAGFTAFWGDSMPSGPIAVLHFAGHGSAGAKDGKIGLRMQDGWMSPNDVHSGVRLGQRDQTFVVLNACEVGGAAQELGVIDGWAASLTANGFGGVLAPLWAVQDGHASMVVREMLQSFVKGTALGEAVRSARSAHREASSTPYAYLCHGDVMASMTIEAKASAVS